MPTLDKFHAVVKTALTQEGWIITHDPYPLSFGGVDLFVDLGAEKLIAAQKASRELRLKLRAF